MNKDNALKTAAGLSKFWDGDKREEASDQNDPCLNTAIKVNKK